MIVIACQHSESKKHGKDRKGNQRLRCKLCGETWTEDTPKPLGNMRIGMKDATLALGMLVEGMSIRSVERLTGLHRDTIDKLVLVVGKNCHRLLAGLVVDVDGGDIQADELWSFVGMKEKTRKTRGHDESFGDSWTFVAVERNTKLVLAYEVGDRDSATCRRFLRKLDRVTTGRFQFSTDGLGAYRLNVPFTLGNRVDFGQLIKNYASSQSTTRYSPATIISAQKKARYGNPKPENICTSHIERLNLTLRMTMRRFTRLTNAHSKSLKHHEAMQAICFAWYNFCRKHETIKMTPAMASGLARKAWAIRDLLVNAA